MGIWAYNPFQGSYNPTYNWFLGPPSTKSTSPASAWPNQKPTCRRPGDLEVINRNES